MVNEEKRLLKVFLCHASGDKPAVRALYQRLIRDGVDAWLDKEKLLPGQDWRLEIPKAVRESDVVVVCLSNKSITKEGYIQTELKFALDIASEKPEGTIFLIPARLEECTVPTRLASWHWVDLFDPDGYERLMRSLRLRADKLGLRVGDTVYTDREVEQKLDQLYTEGLAALWVEDWDKACHRFQAILREKPDHVQAAAKLEEAKRQKYLNDLYLQALDAQQNEGWPAVIEILQKLTSEAPDYKDAPLILKNARKKSQLSELYNEARRLYRAEQWQAILKVFAQISAIEPNYQDPDGLLASAEKEVAELKRLAELNELYSRGVREMDAGRWQEARRLLEQVHKSQTGFLETERLLRKIENEITKLEELKQRNIYVNTLYEQAHELIRSRNWRKALEKIEEILSLDSQFKDEHRIAEKARAELDHEEEIVQRQNELVAMYTEAVRLLKEGKYQEALDKWQEVRAINPKYPDRQGVQRTARKKLAETVKPVQVKPRFVMSKPLWMGVVGLVVVGVVITGIVWSGRRIQGVIPVATEVPGKTSTPHLTTPSSYVDPTMYDDFDNLINGENYNEALWELGGNLKNMNGDTKNLGISQKDGKLLVSVNGQIAVGLDSAKRMRSDSQIFSEARVFLDPNTIDNSSILYVGLGVGPAGASCQIFGFGDNKQDLSCSTGFSGNLVETEVVTKDISPTWHTIRLEFNPETVNFSYFLDGRYMGSTAIPLSSIPAEVTDFPKGNVYVGLGINNSGPSTAPVGYFDYVRMGAIEDDPVTYYDDFEGPTLNSLYQGDLPESSNYRYDEPSSIAYYQGKTGYSFEILDGFSIIRLQNRLNDNSRKGWLIDKTFAATSFELEIRFNTLVQSPRTGIDQMIELWLLDANDVTKYDRTSVLSWDFGGSRSFSAESTISKKGNFLSFNFTDNTWYRLTISGSMENEVITSVYSDDKSKKFVTIPLDHTLSSFLSGFKIGISQSMGQPGGIYPTDVAIDWIRLTSYTVP